MGPTDATSNSQPPGARQKFGAGDRKCGPCSLATEQVLDTLPIQADSRPLDLEDGPRRRFINHLSKPCVAHVRVPVGFACRLAGRPTRSRHQSAPPEWRIDRGRAGARLIEWPHRPIHSTCPHHHRKPWPPRRGSRPTHGRRWRFGSRSLFRGTVLKAGPGGRGADFAQNARAGICTSLGAQGIVLLVSIGVSSLAMGGEPPCGLCLPTFDPQNTSPIGVNPVAMWARLPP